MIKLMMMRVKPEQEQKLRDWMAELSRRTAEVLETFANEGMRHEQAYLLETSDGPVLIYAMDAPDHQRVASAFRSSTLPIDREHESIMKQVLAGPAKFDLLFDCQAEGHT